jgi:hypothetical protein
MVTKSATFPVNIYQALQQLTGEARVEQALPIALKDLIRFKLRALDEKIAAFEQKYGLDFVEFERAWEAGRIENPYSYEVEKDDIDWEIAINQRKDLEIIAKWLE